MSASPPGVVTSYARNREDVIIDGFFDGKEEGFYVDIGAGHPVHNSVTKWFYAKGWVGLHFEANHRLAALTRIDRPKDQVIDSGLVDGSGKRPQKGQQNTADNGFPEGLPRVDFMRISAAGMMYDVLKEYNYAKFNPELVCIEINDLNSMWKKRFEEGGYETFFNDGINEYYALTSSTRRKKFSFVDSVLQRYPKVTSYIPHKDCTEITEDTFSYRKSETREEDLKKNLAGAVSVFNNTLRTLLLRDVTELKRQQLARKIRVSFQRGKKGAVSRISYLKPKIIFLRLMLYANAIGYKVATLVGARGMIK